MKRALVTGAKGFAGAWLTKALLERGVEVTCLDRIGADPERVTTLRLLGLLEEVEDAVCDLRDAEAVSEVVSRVDTVFHLAAETIVGTVQESPAEGFDTNVRGTWNVLEAARQHGTDRVIFASSDKAYGAHEELPYHEDFALQPTAPYEASKAAADLIARSYWHSYGVPVAVTRFANIYGGGDLNFSRLVPEAVCAAVEGRAPVLRSDGSPIRDFLYVEDAARAYLALADKLAEESGRKPGDGSEGVAGEAFNAGGEKPHSVLEVVEGIARLSGTGVEPDIQGEGNPAGEIDRQFVDATKIRERTGWQPQVSLEEGLGRTIEWYRAQPEARPA